MDWRQEVPVEGGGERGRVPVSCQFSRCMLGTSPVHERSASLLLEDWEYCLLS